MADGRVRYARNGDIHLAHRELGEGDITLVWIPGLVSNVDVLPVRSQLIPVPVAGHH